VVGRVEAAFWTLLFLIIGTVILAAHQPGHGAWPIFAAVVSYIAAAVFLFILLFHTEGSR
jgi:hypothetical protein